MRAIGLNAAPSCWTQSSSGDEVTVSRAWHGPFERIVLRVDGPGGAMAVSVYRLGDLLVDSGSGRTANALVGALRGTPPTRIVCTHQHDDHVGGVSALRGAFGQIPVYAPRAHVPILATLGPVPLYREAICGTPERIVDAIAYDEGDRFEACGVTLIAKGTPGHTPGHMALVTHGNDRAFALTGDLYTSPEPLAAWFESAAADAVASCRSLAARTVDLCMLPAHGKVRDDGVAALAQLADFLERQIASVLRAREAADDVNDVREIARRLYGSEGELARRSNGEFSYASFVRSVLDPVQTLPARPVP